MWDKLKEAHLLNEIPLLFCELFLSSMLSRMEIILFIIENHGTKILNLARY